jgi:hypothetical protein
MPRLAPPMHAHAQTANVCHVLWSISAGLGQHLSKTVFCAAFGPLQTLQIALASYFHPGSTGY